MGNPTDTTTDGDTSDPMFARLRQEALEAKEEEPQLTMLLENTILAPGVNSFDDAVASTITYRMLLKPCNAPSPGSMMFCPTSLRGILKDALTCHCGDHLEAGHTMSEAVRKDAQAVCDRDPAVDSLLEVVLFLKGFAALVCHRAAYHKWHTSKKKGKKSMVALWLQSQASAVFGLDIHPAATMGAGILLDHGTGVVIGETATVGDGCTLLHGVTLGGTGKEGGDRHPKVGKDVLIGANSSLLGNIPIGDGAKIGAGSIVLGAIPSGATAVGAPAKIIGRARESKPGSSIDDALQQVSFLHKSASAATFATASVSSSDSANDETGWDDNSGDEAAKSDGKKGKKEPDKTQGKSPKRQDGASQTNCCCPYRDYVEMAKSAPPGSITLVTLRRLLTPEGVSYSTAGEILFTLDTRDVGYIKPEVFFTKETEIVITEKTWLSADRVAKVCADFHRQWQAQN